MTIEELIERSHAMAVEKGWWPDGVPGTRSVVDQVNNFHAEISEAWEEYRAGRMETWYSPRSEKRPEYCDKPEGFWVEIADLVIRLADTMGAYGWVDRKRPWHLGLRGAEAEAIVAFVGRLHRDVDRLVMGTCGSSWSIDAGIVASAIIHGCLDAADTNGIDLWFVIREKMSYNATRPIRHGGLRA